MPTPPKHLKGEALKLWNSITPWLIAMGVAKAIDSGELGRLCQWWARYEQLSRLWAKPA